MNGALKNRNDVVAHVTSVLTQAFVAEVVGDETEALDLFRHSVELSRHVEACRGFAHLVASLARDPERRVTSHGRYVIEKMAALPAACDAMTHYTGEP